MTELVNEVKSWIYEAGETIRESLKNLNIVVDTKTSRTDLVTNIDKSTQDFLIKKIEEFDDQAKILGEENGKNSLMDRSGRVYIVDPIDGTMNFVLEKENFCIMIGIYEDKKPLLGFIYDVMLDRMLWGGPSIGVYCNDDKLSAPANSGLTEGLVGTNVSMYAQNFKSTRDICDIALGTRATGCAGVELIAILLGKRVAYLSHLSPWDYAAGGVLLETFGFKMSRMDGLKLGFEEREYFIAATPKAYEDIQKVIKESKS